MKRFLFAGATAMTVCWAAKVRSERNHSNYRRLGALIHKHSLAFTCSRGTMHPRSGAGDVALFF